jgi:hypothetical protein
MKLYHRTRFSKEILVGGFKDAAGTYGTTENFTGVWFSNTPLDCNEGAFGNEVLVIKIPARIIKPFEWVEEGKPYREFLIPAEIANQYGVPKKIEL